MTPNRRTNVAFAFVFVALMLVGSMPLTTLQAGAHAGHPRELVVDRDPGLYFGFDDTVGIRVMDPARDSSTNIRTAKVNATVFGGSTTQLTLYETLEPNGDNIAGAYVGYLRFAPTSEGPNTIVVPSNANNVTVRLRYDPGEAGGADVTPAAGPVLIDWRRTFDAAIDITKGGIFDRYVGRNATVGIKLTDLDHRNAGDLFVAVRTQNLAWNDALEGGNLVRLFEECAGTAVTTIPCATGTGRFFGNVSFRAATDAPATWRAIDDLYLGTGDNSRTVYQIGSPVVLASVNLTATNLLKPHLGGSDTSLAGDFTVTKDGKVTLDATGRNKLGTRDLVASYSLPTPTATTPGVFIVPVQLGPDPNFGADPVDRIVREPFSVEYEDVRDATGVPIRRAVHGEWLETQAASFFFLDDDLVSPLAPVDVGGGDVVAHMLGAQSKLGMRVLDEDANVNRGVVDSIEVRVASFSGSDAAEVNLALLEEEVVTLRETGPNTGEFAGTVGIESVRVANNDVLQVTTAVSTVTVFKGSYAEGRSGTGAGDGVGAVPLPDADPSTPVVTKPDRVGFTATGTGVVSLLRKTGATVTTEFYGLSSELAKVRIGDSDITACSQLDDRVTVRSTAVTEVEPLPDSIFTRVGTNCEALFGFEPLGTAVNGDADRDIGVADGARVLVEYRDPMNAAGQLNQIVTATATWRQAFDASVAFGGKFFTTIEDVPLVVQDPDLDANNVFVHVTTLEDPTGIVYTLNRDTTSPVPGTYRGFAKFETPEEARIRDVPRRNDEVAASNEGVAKAFYDDPRRSNGDANVRLPPDLATVLHHKSGAAELSAETIVLTVPMEVVVKDGNAGSAGHDVLLNISTRNKALDGNVATDSAADVRDPGETIRVPLAAAVTRGTSTVSTEGGKRADAFVATGGPNQKFIMPKFPIKPCDGVEQDFDAKEDECLDGVKVYVGGVQWGIARNNSFGPVPPPRDATGQFTCGAANQRFENCNQVNKFVIDHAFGRIKFGNDDDTKSWPLAGERIIVVYEPYEYYTEFHRLTESPFGSVDKALELHNKGMLAGVLGQATARNADGTPPDSSGETVLHCRDDPDTPLPTATAGPGALNERSRCWNKRKILLHNEEIVTVKVDGEVFTWCPDLPGGNNGTSECDNRQANPTAQFNPPSKQFTLLSDGRFWLGSPAGKDSIVEITYRSYDLFAGKGRDYNIIGAVSRPSSGTCQVNEVNPATLAETLLVRSLPNAGARWQYTDSSSDTHTIRFNATGPTMPVTFGDRVRVYPKVTDRVLFGEEGNNVTSTGHVVYKAENAGPSGSLNGNEIRFKLANPRVCNSGIFSVITSPGLSGDVIQIRVIFPDIENPNTGDAQPVPGKGPGPSEMQQCIINLNPSNPELYHTGIVRIRRAVNPAACANLDSNTTFQVAYQYGSEDADILIDETVRRGVCVSNALLPCGAEAIPDVPFRFPGPLQPDLEVRDCFGGGDCFDNAVLDAVAVVVNPRTGDIDFPAGSVLLTRPVMSKINLQGRLISQWNNEVGVGLGDSVKVTYFDVSNSADDEDSVSYEIPPEAVKTVTKGEVMFLDSGDTPRTEFFGLDDYANVTVVDGDRNRDPGRVETIKMRLKAVAVGRLGPDTGLPAFNEEITLFEESGDSDTFRARLKLGTFAGTPPVGLKVIGLGLAKGNQFALSGEYTDEHQPPPVAGIPYTPVIIAGAAYRPATRGEVTVDTFSKLGLSSPVTIRVVDADRDGRLLQERVGRSTGDTSQSMFLKYKPFRPQSQIVYVEEMLPPVSSPISFVPPRFEAWKQVDDPTSAGNGNSKVYSVDSSTGQLRFGTCRVSAGSESCISGGNGRVPVKNAEIRVDYFQKNDERNRLFVRVESYVLDPSTSFDPLRDAHPEEAACPSATNPRCYDRIDLEVQEVIGSPGAFQRAIPFPNVAEERCIQAGAIVCPNMDGNDPNALELPNRSPGVDDAIILVTYFDYSYGELLRKQTTKVLNPACAVGGGSDGHPGEPFQQLMAGQVFPGLALPQDPDCQVPFTPRDRIQRVVSFREATSGDIGVTSRSMLLPHGGVDRGGAGSADDFADSERLVYGQGKLLVSVTDGDLNAKRDLADLGAVTLATTSSPTGASFSLNEVIADSGTFVNKAGIGPGGTVTALARDRYSVTYNDAQNANGLPSPLRLPADLSEEINYRWYPSATATTSLSRAAFISPETGTGAQSLPVVTVFDRDRNVNATDKDALRVRLSAVDLRNLDVDAEADARDFYGLGDCADPGAVVRTLDETGLDTGVFRKEASLGGLGLSDGETVVVTYCDPHDALGHEGPLAACPGVVGSGKCRVGTSSWDSAEWFRRSHGQVSFDKERYVERTEFATLTVNDEGLSGLVDKVPVVLQFGSTAVKIDLLETADGSGEFTARVGFQETGKDTDGIFDISVADNQPIRAIYVDTTVDPQAAPGRPGASVAKALFAKDTLPPTTTHAVESSVDPVTRGSVTWFRSPPSITLTAVDDLSEVARIEYRWDNAVDYEVALGAIAGPFSPPTEGVHVLRYRAVDVVGNTEAEHNLTVNWDQTAPTVSVTQLNATRAPGGIRLSWTSPVDRNDPLQFGEFQMFRDVTTGVPAATSTNTTAIVTAPDEQEHTYFVRIVDAAGNEGPLSAGVAAIADITPPTMSDPTILPRTTFAVGEVAKVDFTVKVLPTPDDVVASVEVTVAVPGSGTDAVVMADPDGDNVYTGSYANFTDTGLYEVTFRALDAIGNAATAAFTINVTGRDTTAPTITPLAENTVVPQGEALRVRVRDNIGVTRVTYRIDGGADRQATYAADNETALIPTADLALGPHTVVVRAFDAAGNSATAQLAFVVIAPLPPGVPPPPLDVRLVTQASGNVVLRWIMVPSANLDRFEIWRSSSPAKIVGTVDPDTCTGGECTFTDRTAKSGTTYTYCILAVNSTGGSAGLDHPSTPCSKVKAAGAISSPGGNFLERFWWVFLIAAAIVVGVAVFLVQREERAKKSRSRQKLESLPTGPGERHHIKCPACETRFTVTGTKPIVTNCPHCGKKGILR